MSHQQISNSVLLAKELPDPGQLGAIQNPQLKTKYHKEVNQDVNIMMNQEENAP